MIKMTNSVNNYTLVAIISYAIPPSIFIILGIVLKTYSIFLVTILFLFAFIVNLLITPCKISIADKSIIFFYVFSKRRIFELSELSKILMQGKYYVFNFTHIEIRGALKPWNHKQLLMFANNINKLREDEGKELVEIIR